MLSISNKSKEMRDLILKERKLYKEIKEDFKKINDDFEKAKQTKSSLQTILVF